MVGSGRTGLAVFFAMTRSSHASIRRRATAVAGLVGLFPATDGGVEARADRRCRRPSEIKEDAMRRLLRTMPVAAFLASVMLMTATARSALGQEQIAFGRRPTNCAPPTLVPCPTTEPAKPTPEPRKPVTEPETPRPPTVETEAPLLPDMLASAV